MLASTRLRPTTERARDVVSDEKHKTFVLLIGVLGGRWLDRAGESSKKLRVSVLPFFLGGGIEASGLPQGLEHGGE
jgi:hypothetical protein